MNMSANGLIILAACGFMALLVGGAPFLLPLAAGAENKSIPVKAWLVVAAVLVLCQDGCR